MAFSQTALTEREFYFATLPVMEVPSTFNHAGPATPTPPEFPEALNQAEQDEVMAWRRQGTAPSLAAAVAKVAEYVLYAAAYAAWKHADHLAKVAQYRWAIADASVVNKPSSPASSNPTTGTGSDPPPAYVPPQGTQEP